MDSELQRQEYSPKQQRLQFEVVEKNAALTQYIFNKVVIVIDRSGRNIKDVPELLFATYDYDPAQASLEQPDFKRSGVDMDYIARCIKEVVRLTGDDQFWIHPYSEDAKHGEEKQRLDARARLFSKFATLEENPTGPGYFITLNT